MFKKIKDYFKKPTPPGDAAPIPKKEKPVDYSHRYTLQEKFDAMIKQNIRRSAKQDIVLPKGMAADQAPYASPVFQNTVPNSLMFWYGAQTFIGYQMAAIIAQHWLILKCCSMPAKDAIRKGYETTVNDGSEIPPEIKDAITQLDIKYRLNEKMEEFITKGRIFGFRIALFKVRTLNAAEYYGNPFNIDAITPGSYEGIVQVDPYWITPELDFEAGANPASLHFYEPTWWCINGIHIHRSHLIIFRNGELADILKPTYLYGGIPVPQQIYERVYCAERTANEAPQLALTKRVSNIFLDQSTFLANQEEASAKFEYAAQIRDNYGFNIYDTLDRAEQQDLSLAHLDETIMTQYQLVAAAARVPATKLLGTTPKGFNATGEYEEASYHEELENIQTSDLTPFIERHHEILIRSEICPQFGCAPFATAVCWKPLDAMTAEEQAALNKTKAETDQILRNIGAIDGFDARTRVVSDPDSGYNGLDVNDIPEEPSGDPDEYPEEKEETFV